MSFPKWGHSFNALYVPLTGGWHCALMPAHEVQEIDRAWRLPFKEREQKRKEQKKQIEQDRQDFDRLFRVDTDRRGAGASSEFREYADFINKRLRVSSWSKPVDGNGIARVLRDAVRHGRLVPAIARNWRGGQRAFRHYAPQHWPTRHGISYGGATAPTGRFTGAFAAAMHAADTVMKSRLASNGRALRSEAGGRSSIDWLSTAGAVTAGVFVDADSGDGSGSDSMLKSFGDSDGDNSLVGDAQPYEYRPGSISDETLEVAGIPNTTGDPNSWIESGPGIKKQWRMFGPDGSAAVDIDFDSHHGQPNPHAHNWDGTSRDQGWPVSILP